MDSSSWIVALTRRPSRTTWPKRAGVPAASRKVFLDDVASRDAILKQLNLAARDAQRDGFTIAIGHPRPATIAALAEGVPPLEARGIHLVFASELVN